MADFFSIISISYLYKIRLYILVTFLKNVI